MSRSSTIHAIHGDVADFLPTCWRWHLAPGISWDAPPAGAIFHPCSMALAVATAKNPPRRRPTKLPLDSRPGWVQQPRTVIQPLLPNSDLLAMSHIVIVCNS